MPQILGLEQNTPEWLQMRVGMVTGSRMGDVLAFSKRDATKELQARADYRMELVCEALTGRAQEHYVSPAMQWGTDTEPLAAAAYEIERDVELESGGFFIHDAISRFGASPDRLVGSDGLIEIKCPTTATHIDYLIAGQLPEQYLPQMVAELACTGRKWCDFVSFDPRLPRKYQLFIRRLERTDESVAIVERAVLQFLAELDATIAKLADAVGCNPDARASAVPQDRELEGK